MKNGLILGLAALVLVSCQNSNKKAGTEQKKSNITITAAGATFPLPFYNMIFKTYSEASGVQITYGGIGSGGGIRSLTDKVVDFGATDAYLEDAKISEMGAPVVHIPTCIGAVVIAYNLPSVTGLKLSDKNLEDIFLGKVTKWNDQSIVANNPELKLPATSITFVHRSDGSGTTQIFSDYMSKISENWKTKVGVGKDLNWVCGIGAKGNPGVAGTIKQTEGAIGYIGSEYAFAQKIEFAQLKNSAGNYIAPTMESISASANGEIPTDTRVMLTNSSDANAYPICGFTWLILYKDQNYGGRTKEQATEVINLLNWVIGTEAQSVAAKVDYAPLPQKAVELSKEILKGITFGGEVILK